MKKSDLNTEAYERGARLRRLRDDLKLSRQMFSERFGISKKTIWNWEKGDNGGINNKTAEKLVEMFLSLNIQCTAEWFLYGSGLTPVKISELVNAPSERQCIQEELHFFHQRN